jgi:hypothetical protein
MVSQGRFLVSLLNVMTLAGLEGRM